MDKEIPKSTDDFFQDALESKDVAHLLEVEKEIVARMLPNKGSLHERAELVFNALDRRLILFQGLETSALSRESNKINRWIAYATIISVIGAVVIGCFQLRSAFDQIDLQNKVMISEYRPYLGTYFSSEDQIDPAEPISAGELPGKMAGCNFRGLGFDKEGDSVVFSIPVKNYGKTPARYSLSDLGIRSPSSTRYLIGSLLAIKDGLLMPGEHIDVRYQMPITEAELGTGFKITDVDFVASITYRQLGKEVNYSTVLAIKSKPLQTGSQTYCTEIINDIAS